ncbi:hypothetical protein BJ875DRAFT_30222 [Amylocarpus encephaloides]|uniref:Uncharacterized protein n=1 Tax=Amylocarpus encephaloides TaxID=45428 RepID=A0A9P7YI68_9HELO|nr:hypothetical protein BJ875DRAFT_30222 [Amylocarpus encephaloides]
MPANLTTPYRTVQHSTAQHSKVPSTRTSQMTSNCARYSASELACPQAPSPKPRSRARLPRSRGCAADQNRRRHLLADLLGRLGWLLSVHSLTHSLRSLTPHSGHSLLTQDTHSSLRTLTPHSGHSLLTQDTHSLRTLTPHTGHSLLTQDTHSLTQDTHSSHRTLTPHSGHPLTHSGHSLTHSLTTPRPRTSQAQLPQINQRRPGFTSPARRTFQLPGHGISLAYVDFGFQRNSRISAVRGWLRSQKTRPSSATCLPLPRGIPKGGHVCI